MEVPEKIQSLLNESESINKKYSNKSKLYGSLHMILASWFFIVSFLFLSLFISAILYVTVHIPIYYTIIIVGFILLILFSLFIYNSFKTTFNVYITDNSIIYYRKSLINSKIDIIELSNIESVDAQLQNLFFKNGTINIQTKNSSENLTISYIKNPYQIQKYIRQKKK